MDFSYNYSLTNLNSFRTEAKAKVYCRPKSAEDIRQIIETFADANKLILGEGCNLFFTKDFDGIVIHPEMFGIKILPDENLSCDESTVYIEVQASENWDSFVKYCVANNFAGAENLSLIPSSVGAAPVQNIGAYGVEVKDIVYAVNTIDLNTGREQTFYNYDCMFDYRNSIFKTSGNLLITSVVFCLNRKFAYKPKYTDLNNLLAKIDNPSLQQVRNAVIEIRRRKLPDEKILPNAGSFFKNPYIDQDVAKKLKIKYPDMPQYMLGDGKVKVPAAFLIDKSGCKAKREGDVGTYPSQPLVIVNYGRAKGTDIVAFMKTIQKKVFYTFGIALEPEVRIY